MKLDNLLERIRQHPIGQAIEREDRAEKLAARHKLVAQLKQLDHDFVDQLPEIEAAKAGAEAELEAARSVLRECEANLFATQVDESRARGEYDRRHGVLFQELIASADPAIDAFIGEMLTELDRTQHQCQAVEHWVMNRRTCFSRPVVYSNSASVNRRMAAIRAACERAETMKIEDLDDAAIASMLESLRELPPIEAIGAEPLVTTGDPLSA